MQYHLWTVNHRLLQQDQLKRAEDTFHTNGLDLFALLDVWSIEQNIGKEEVLHKVQE